MLTTQIITKNNEKTIARTLDSLKGLPGEIIVADLGSTDETIKICRSAGARVYNADFNYDFSQLRNQIVKESKNDWQFWINPWEAITQGSDRITKTLDSDISSWQVLVVRDDLLMKELRLWRKSSGSKFERPVFESLEPNTGNLLDAVICAEVTNDLKLTLDIVNRWRDHDPTSPEPDYYLALTYLMHHRHDDFLRMAEHYLFKKHAKDDTILMIRYYAAQTYALVKKNPTAALNNIIECIAAQPTMAEFWCLLGDIYLRLQDLERAKQFYENAKVLGSQRPPNDDLPMEMSKYDEYPQKLLKAIGAVIS